MTTNFPNIIIGQECIIKDKEGREVLSRVTDYEDTEGGLMIWVNPYNEEYREVSYPIADVELIDPRQRKRGS